MTTVAALSACAVAPGMRMDTTLTATDRAIPAVVGDGAAFLPIVSIDAALIRRQEKARSANLAALETLVLRGDNAYRIAPGDVLQITVWDHPELAAAQGAPQQTPTRNADPIAGFVVDDGGNLTLPYAGELKVAGLSTAEAQQQVKTALARVYREPQVTLRVASYRSQQVYVDGEVHSPGSLPFNDVAMTLADALARAGGFTPAADQSEITLVRDGQSTHIDMTQLLARHRSPSTVALCGGDILRIGARDERGVYVMGEVNKPTTAVPKRDGRLTLSDALLQAGSINSNTADAAQMFVIRTVKEDSEGEAGPVVFHLDAHSPVAMVLASEFELHPKDIVYVDGNGLVRLSRVLSLLLPSFNTGTAAALATK